MQTATNVIILQKLIFIFIINQEIVVLFIESFIKTVKLIYLSIEFKIEPFLINISLVFTNINTSEPVRILYLYVRLKSGSYGFKRQTILLLFVCIEK